MGKWFLQPPEPSFKIPFSPGSQCACIIKGKGSTNPVRTSTSTSGFCDHTGRIATVDSRERIPAWCLSETHRCFIDISRLLSGLLDILSGSLLIFDGSFKDISLSFYRTYISTLPFISYHVWDAMLEVMVSNSLGLQRGVELAHVGARKMLW